VARFHDPKSNVPLLDVPRFFPPLTFGGFKNILVFLEVWFGNSFYVNKDFIYTDKCCQPNLTTQKFIVTNIKVKVEWILVIEYISNFRPK
jgi:hypothetical protein